MDDVILQELKRTVEQAVRPVRATMARKRRMREELLAHLVAIFEEEAGKLGDEQAALEQAKLRFGDPRELTGQLQQAVPWWDRFRSILENMGCQPDESAWHLAGKHFLLVLLICIVWVPTWLLAHGNMETPGPAEAQRLYALVLVGCVPLMALFNVIRFRSLGSAVDKGWSRLGLEAPGTHLLLAVLCAFVVPCCLILPPFLAGAAVLFTLMARQAVNEWRYQGRLGITGQLQSARS